MKKHLKFHTSFKKSGRLSRGSRILSAVLLLGLLIMGASTGYTAELPANGRDLLPVFGRAAQGKPLRFVLMGGSIAQASGNDCWIGDWLRKQFPESAVVTHNAALSAHGSRDNLFRLEREVIAQQPDMVILEHVANDGNTPDLDAVRFMESMIVRLKSLPRPPAIVYVEVARNEKGTPSRIRLRQRRVSDHYQLLSIDLEAAVAKAVANGEITWNGWSGNGKGTDAHPSAAGHALYGRAIAAALQPLANYAKQNPISALKVKAPELPKPLSSSPLLLDAMRMAPTPNAQWGIDRSRPVWYFNEFRHTVKNLEPGSTMTIPFRGTWVGLVCPVVSKSNVMALVSIDGGEPEKLFLTDGINRRFFARDLEPKTHTITIAIPEGEGGTMYLGAIALAGADHATHELAPQGKYAGSGLLKHSKADQPLVLSASTKLAELDSVFNNPPMAVLRPTNAIRFADAPAIAKDTDCSAALFLAADREHLYIGAKVLDDKASPKTFPVDQLWKDDSLELWVNNNQIVVGPGEKGVGIRSFRHRGGDTGQLKELQGTFRRMESFADDKTMLDAFGREQVKGPGWIMTVALPWKLVAEITPDQKFEFYFAASVNDNDEGERKFQLNFPSSFNFGNKDSFQQVLVR